MMLSFFIYESFHILCGVVSVLYKTSTKIYRWYYNDSYLTIVNNYSEAELRELLLEIKQLQNKLSSIENSNLNTNSIK